MSGRLPLRERPTKTGDPRRIGERKGVTMSYSDMIAVAVQSSGFRSFERRSARRMFNLSLLLAAAMAATAVSSAVRIRMNMAPSHSAAAAAPTRSVNAILPHSGVV